MDPDIEKCWKCGGYGDYLHHSFNDVRIICECCHGLRVRVGWNHCLAGLPAEIQILHDACAMHWICWQPCVDHSPGELSRAIVTSTLSQVAKGRLMFKKKVNLTG